MIWGLREGVVNMDNCNNSLTGLPTSTVTPCGNILLNLLILYDMLCHPRGKVLLIAQVSFLSK